MRPRDQEQGRGDVTALERLVTFGDAVVAIAITLIVLPMVEQAIEAESAARFFAANALSLLTAALSFVVVAVIWHAHHRLFARASGYTPAVIRLELLWLATIVFLPVATALDVLGEADDPLALGVYIGTILLSSLLVRVQALLLERSGLVAMRVVGFWDRWLGALLMALALVLAVLFPTVGAFWLLLLLLEGPLLRLIRPREG
ncbi:TMEM175 family protein [Microbacterium oryzae]|uniref:TMEM175 family protein n=1 Tax=Microbacterium oryzae TaxID=743009 RepID=UPI0025B0E07E|nr:TMEM175 family protein [Microbacterium oryzae]MDN3311006.1 TMEM175 family protein [Microbacterium oryzae]